MHDDELLRSLQPKRKRAIEMKLNASLMKISRSQPDDDVCAVGHTVEAQFENMDGFRQAGAERFICRLRRNPSSFSPRNEIQTDFIHAQRWHALAQAGSRIAVSNERLVNLLVHNCQGRPICCYSPHVFSKKKKGAALPRSQLSTSNITSSMIGAPRGKLATPITDRTDILPTPNTSRRSSDAASATIGWL